MTDFTKLNLADPIAKALVAEGYKTPTPIQAQSIPLVMEGHDLLGIAQTGTGKTAAFAVPTLDRLHRLGGKPKDQSTRILVLAPTRELAGQIADSYTAYGQFLKLNIVKVFGGVPIKRQMNQLSRGADVLVATPGRLLDLIDQKALTLRDVEILILDEADQMLDLGFIHSLKRIVPMLPKKRQTLFFSATMPKTISSLAQKFLTDPVHVSVAPIAATAERVEQRAIFAEKADKQALLTLTIRKYEIGRALVFTRTKHGANKVVNHLIAAGITAAAIHGNKSQPQREKALAAFKSGGGSILVATDIAARGIDIDHVSHVINYEIPNVPEQYVHRIGRTGRAGREGLAISFVDREERAYMRDIEKLTRIKVPAEGLPEGFAEDSKEIKALRPVTKRHVDPRRNSKKAAGKGKAKPGAGRTTGQGGTGKGSGRRSGNPSAAQGEASRAAEAGGGKKPKRNRRRKPGTPGHASTGATAGATANRPKGGSAKSKGAQSGGGNTGSANTGFANTGSANTGGKPPSSGKPPSGRSPSGRRPNRGSAVGKGSGRGIKAARSS